LFCFVAGGSVTNEAAATKIVELSKRVRELTAELQSEKTKVKQYGKKCMDLQQQVIFCKGEELSLCKIKGVRSY
jgi:hypothetical protein